MSRKKQRVIMDNKTVSKLLPVFILLVVTLAKITAGSPTKSESTVSNDLSKNNPQTFAKTSKKPNAMEETIEFLEEGYKSLNLTQNPDIVVVLGNTGAGKTTFTHFIAADNDQLVSVKANDDPYSTDYIIEDNLNKISNRNETTISKTIVPELVTDEEGIAWYDSPGFSDTRNTTVEIAATFFINQVIDHGKRIKMVFVVNYASVTTGLDRTDFDNLVRYSVNLIRNVSNYKLSIALVVTKVEAYPPHSEEPLPQWVIAQRTGTYIENYRQGLMENVDEEETARAINFLDLLLNKDVTGNYTQIGVFFRPDKEGPLSEIPLLQKNRVETRQMLQNNLNYSEIIPNDFGYTLSAKAQNDIIELSQFINKNVTDSVKNIGEEVVTFFKQKETDVRTLMALRDLFKSAAGAIADLKTVDDELTLKIFLTKIQKFLTDERIFIPKSDIENIFNQQKYLEFLNRVSTKLLPISPNDWIAALQKCFNYISAEENWYTFLVALYDDLSDYNIQKDLELYDVADLSNWGKGGGIRGIFINHYNFKDFVKLQKKYDYLLKDIEVDDTMLATVNSVLNVTLKHVIEYQCEGDKLTVRREYLRLSEIDLGKCGSNIKHVQFYALNTFFTDSNLNFSGNEKEVAIIANKHVVTTNAVFSLQGEDSTFIPEKQPDPDKKHLAGTPGVPGEPGSNGGSFMALFNEVLNGERLTVNVYGGAGSAGQGGGAAWPQRAEVKISTNTYKVHYGDSMFKDLDKVGDLDKLKSQGLITAYNYDILGYLFNPDPNHKGKIDYYLHYKCCEADGLAGAGKNFIYFIR